MPLLPSYDRLFQLVGRLSPQALTVPELGVAQALTGYNG
jgi:hypothetical protein